MSDKSYSIDELLESLDELMNVVSVNKVSKDETYNPLEVFSKSRANEPNPETSENANVLTRTKEFLNKLKYVNFPGDIIQYSRISEKMFDKKYNYDAVENIAQEIFDIVTQNFSCVLEDDPKLKKRFYKLVDHMMLASFQLGEIAQHSIEKYEVVAQKLSESNEQLEEYKKALVTSTREMRDEQTKIYMQFVTILGIFTAIVFSMFGGLELMEFALTSQRFETWKSITFFSMFAISTLCMLFILMRWISIIIDNVNRTQRKFKFRGIISSHFGFTVAMIFFMYLMFIAALFSNKIVLENFQSWVAGISNYLVLGFVLFLPILIFVLFLVVYIYNKKPTQSR